MNKHKPKKKLNNSYNSVLTNNIIVFKLIFDLNLIILKTKFNFNLLKINSIAICSAIIVRDLFDYLYVRIINDIAIFP